jgi:shikimate kinase
MPDTAALPERIVLTGFMGSGKSTVGRLLAERLGLRFADLDALIEQREGLTVPEMFAQRGEAAFRRAETAALMAALAQQGLVLALGGGAIESEANRALLQHHPAVTVVFLDASFETLNARCQLQAADPSATARPLLVDLHAAEERFRRRRPLYRSAATHTLDTEILSAMEASEALAEVFMR